MSNHESDVIDEERGQVDNDHENLSGNVVDEPKLDEVNLEGAGTNATEGLESLSQKPSENIIEGSESTQENVIASESHQNDKEKDGDNPELPFKPADQDTEKEKEIQQNINREDGVNDSHLSGKALATDSNSIKYDVEQNKSPDIDVGEDEEEDTHPLDELTDQQVIDLVQELDTENRHLFLENRLFESFLMENDPSLLEGLEEIMKFLLNKPKDTLERQPSNTTDMVKFRLDSYTSITSIAEGKGPKINLSQKTDMVIRAMEENQTNLEAFLKKCHVIKRNLKSELEEFSIREAEIKEATDIFEFNVVTQGLDKLTQRIPAEKFIRYMEEWLKSAQLQIEKLRLRIATLKVQYKKVSQQLIQRQELGENVHAVDFDQLEIENKHFIEKIEQKNIHLIELKKMNGGANLILSNHKKFLQKQQEDCNAIKAEIEAKNKQIEDTEKECEDAEEELNAEIEKYENCKKLKNQYTVPDVMEYVKLKGILHDLKKSIKIWARRKKIQDIALNTCLREMKNLTGRTDVDPAWFEEIQSLSESSGSDDSLML